MSELKEVMNVMQVSGERIPSGYYKKSEADKVIADKDAEIAELKEQVHDYAQGLYVIQARAEKEACHHKYKRCLDMAKICENKLGTVVKPGWWDKWRRHWLELAEKFKPDNSTAQ